MATQGTVARRRVNVHYVLDIATKAYCLDINRALTGIAGSLIRFEGRAAVIPHMTIVMGEMESGTDIEDVVSRVRATCHAVALPYRGAVGKPYLSRANGHYVLCDLEPSTNFEATQEQVTASLRGYVRAGRDRDPMPHITLGYVESGSPALEKYLAEFRDRPPSFSATEIEVSQVGPHGTCVDSRGRLSVRSRDTR
jgi:2'-5' RNA ligase